MHCYEGLVQQNLLFVELLNHLSPVDRIQDKRGPGKKGPRKKGPKKKGAQEKRGRQFLEKGKKGA